MSAPEFASGANRLVGRIGGDDRSITHKRRRFTGRSSHSGRRGFAGKVLASTGDMDTVAILLDHSTIDCSQRYVDVDPATLEDMFANAV